MTKSTGHSALPRLSALLPAILMLGASDIAMSHDIAQKPATSDSYEARTLELASFNIIELSANALIEVREGAQQSVSISTEVGNLDFVDVRIEDGTLRIDGGENANSPQVTLEITVPASQAMKVLSSVGNSVDGNHTDIMRFVFDDNGAVSLGRGCRLVSYQFASDTEDAARQFKCHSVRADVSGADGAKISTGEILCVRGSGSEGTDAAASS